MTIDQGNIIEKLNIYLKSRHLEELDIEGLCNGFVGLYVYKGAASLEQLLHEIADQDEAKLKELRAGDPLETSIRTLIDSIVWLQNTSSYEIKPNDLKDIGIISEQEPLIKEYSLAFVFYGNEFKETLEYLSKENKSITISSYNHIIGIEYRNNLYYPNANIIEQEFHNIDNLIIALNKGFKIVSLFYPYSIDIYRKQSQHASNYIARTEYLNDLLSKRKYIGINSATTDGVTALFLAAQNGHSDIVGLLLHQPFINVNQRTKKEEFSPLMIAAQNGYVDIVDTLLKAKADPFLTNASGSTPLHAAARAGKIKVVEKLLENNAVRMNINALSKENDTPLMDAANSGHTDIVNLFLSLGANADISNDKKYTPLHIAALFGHSDIVTALINNNANVNNKLLDGDTVLHSAAANFSKPHFSKIVENLLRAGASINVQNAENETPLSLAVIFQNKEATNILLANNANPNLSNLDNRTPLHIAAQEGQSGITRLLLDKGANVSLVDNDKQETPLHLAATNGHTEVIKLLLAKGADINILNSVGNSALQLAIGAGRLSATKFLVTHHATLSNDIQADINSILADLTTEKSNYPPDPDKIINLYKKLGCTYATNGENQKAKAAYTEALNLTSTDTVLLNAYGTLLADDGLYADALPHLQDAVINDANNIDYLINLGNILYELSKFSEANECYDKVLTLDSSHVNTLYNKGLCLIDLNKHPEALNYLVKAYALQPHDSDIMIAIGDTYFAIKDYNAASNVYKKLLAIKPDDPDILYHYAEELSRYGKKQEAFQFLLKSAHLLYKQGDFQESQQRFEQALNVKPTLENFKQVGNILLNDLKDYSAAAKVYNHVLNHMDSNNIESLTNMGITSYHLNQHKTGLNYFQQAISVGADNACLTKIASTLDYFGYANEAGMVRTHKSTINSNQLSTTSQNISSTKQNNTSFARPRALPGRNIYSSIQQTSIQQSDTTHQTPPEQTVVRSSSPKP